MERNIKSFLEAQELIKEAALKGTKELNLWALGLTTIPEELWNLTSLTSLDLSSNEITTIPANIRQLKNLTELIISENLLTTLPAEIKHLDKLSKLRLDYNQLLSLPPEIGNLTSLILLTARDNRLSTLPPEIGKLTNLVSIDFSNNLLTTIPSEIGKLKSLTSLSLWKNKLTYLPREIERLTKLPYLDLQENQLFTLPAEIGNLTNLRWINLSKNQLASLPMDVIRLTNLKAIYIQDNNLGIPPEIVNKADDPQIILNYVIRLGAGKKKALNETKVLVVGQGSVGKTSLIRRILDDEYDSEEGKTEGIDIRKYKFRAQDHPYTINVWDFGGQEIMHATHQFFLTKRSLYLLVLDSRLTQEENRVEYWLKIIQSFGSESPILIAGNKTDQHPLDIDRTGLQKKYPNIVGIFETSAATGFGIGLLKNAIAKQVNNMPHIRDLLPGIWFMVKAQLEGLGQEVNFITHDKYLEMCAENEVSDETSQRTLIGFLHDLGVVLHFQDDPRLEALGILNPQWVTNGVYKILNSHTLFQNKGILTASMLDEILNLPEYPRGKRLFIVDMMKKFELCYDIEADKIFLVPDLLPKDEPAELKFNGVPAFEYAYPVLPSSVITRFIVRMNQKIEDGFVWRTGVVLKIGENLALVKADIEDRQITIAIDGVEHTRRDALSAIRYQLDEIHGSIKGLEPQKRVPIPEAPNADPLDYDYLLQLERDGELEVLPVKDGSRLVKVNVRKMLSGVISETERRQSAGNTTNIYIGGDVKGGTIIAGDENEVKK